MSLKNYYTVLGVPQTAGADEIKNAFRALAKKYHPDAAPDNPYAEAHFAAIAEAYEVLSDTGRRAAYDEERWLRGFGVRSKAVVQITPEWIKSESGRLLKHMHSIDSYRMNHATFRDYILLLLSDEHLSVLRGEISVNALIADDILQSAQKLHQAYVPDVLERLILLADGDAALMKRVADWNAQRRNDALWHRYKPLVILAVAALLSLLFWALSRGR